jgi:hypothetical protein
MRENELDEVRHQDVREENRHDDPIDTDRPDDPQLPGGVRERLRAVRRHVRSGGLSGMATRDNESCQESGGLSHFLRSLLAGIPWSERAGKDFEAVFDAPDAGRIQVVNANGKTRVIGEDREDVVLRGHKNARAESEQAAEALLDSIRVRPEEVAGVLTLEAEIPRKWNRHGSIDLELRVPQHTAVDVSSSNGKVCLTGLRHGVRAHSSNGSIRLDDVSGDIDITTANAQVCCHCTCGRLVARSSNGKIEVGDHSGAIDATTSNGLIHATLTALDPEGVTLATSNGRIVLELPEKPDADVDIRVDNGVIRSDLALGNEVREAAGRLRGRLGRGGNPIKLRTSNGTISVR